MKKLFFSILSAVSMVSLTACQSEEDVKVPSSSDSSIEASFPKGATVKSMNVCVPEEARSRAGETNLPLWEMFENDSQSLFIRYAVYDEDGSLFYSTDSANVPKTIDTRAFKISFPTPGENYKIFVWADKLGKDPAGYTIDWENHTVSIPNQTDSKLTADMSKLADAWYCWVSEVGESNTTTLTRATAQVNIISDEMGVNGIKNKYGDKDIITSVGLCTSDDHTVSIPTVWHWNTDTYDFVAAKSTDFRFNKSENPTMALYEGNDYDYLACAYFFAPAAKDGKGVKMIDDATGDEYSCLQININSEGTLINSHHVSDIDQNLARNWRVVIRNKPFGAVPDDGDDDPDDGGHSGLLTPGQASLSVSVIGDFDHSWATQK